MRGLAGPAIVLIGLCGGCFLDSSGPAGPDPQPLPAAPAIHDLSVVRVTPSRVSVEWTARLTGYAVCYDIRYADFPLANSSWDRASRFIYPYWIRPCEGGETDSCGIVRLRAGTTYYFGLKERGDDTDWSAISNTATATTSAAGAIQWVALLPADGVSLGPVLASHNSYIYMCAVQECGLALLAYDVSNPSCPVRATCSCSFGNVAQAAVADGKVYVLVGTPRWPCSLGPPFTLHITPACPMSATFPNSYSFANQDSLLGFVAGNDRLYSGVPGAIEVFDARGDSTLILAARVALPADFSQADLYLSGRTLLACNFNHDRVDVFDVTDPDHPELRSIYSPGAIVNYAKLRDTTLCLFLQNHDVQVVDISDPAAPTLRSVIRLTEYAVDAAIQGHYAYLCWYDRVVAIDLSTSGQSAIVDYSDCTPYPRGISADESYLYVSQGDGWPRSIDILRSNLP